MSQRLGSPLEEGQVLFEVAPLNDYRVVLQVDDRDMAGLRIGQSGTLLLSSLPHDELSLPSRRSRPCRRPKRVVTAFRVEARLTTPTVGSTPARPWRVGKLQVDQRSLVWIWTHEVLDEARLKLLGLGCHDGALLHDEQDEQSRESMRCS